MLARIILGAIGGYGLYLVASAISLSGQGHGGFNSLQAAMAFYWGGFNPTLLIPTILGAVAGYCWHLLASGRND